jgi:RNA polymerase sigma-70 factor (ECF subfamily)
MGSGEAELLARCQAGEAEAWNTLFDLHYGPASRFVVQLAPDLTREDVEEVCQEVFLNVVKNLHTFLGNSQFQTWLFRIAANKARDYRQRVRAAKRGGGLRPIPLHQDPRSDLPPPDPASPTPGPDVALLRAEDIGLVGEALEHLGGPCQEIIELRYFGDLSYEEISATLQLNPKTVSSRLSKCLDKLEVLTRRLMAQTESARPLRQAQGGPLAAEPNQTSAAKHRRENPTTTSV